MTNKPIGATQEQLEENNIEWVLCSGYGIGVNKPEPKWALRHSSEYDWLVDKVGWLI